MTLEQKAKFGRNLIWIGLLAWVPYIVAHSFKYQITLTPFLIIHLTGVLGGAYLRKQSSNFEGPISKKTRVLKTISTILLLLGVAVWVVYLGLKWFTSVETETTSFIIFHLSFMLSGAGIKIYNFLTTK